MNEKPEHKIDESRFFDPEVRKLVRHQFILFVAGASPVSNRAISNFKRIAEIHLKNRFELTVIDVLKQSEMATKYQIVAVPTLVRVHPNPQRKIVGDLRETETLLQKLGLFKTG